MNRGWSNARKMCDFARYNCMQLYIREYYHSLKFLRLTHTLPVVVPEAGCRRKNYAPFQVNIHGHFFPQLITEII